MSPKTGHGKKYADTHHRSPRWRLTLKRIREKPRERGSMNRLTATEPGVNAGPITAARQAP